MANIKKAFNFRNGVQVDDDNLIVNSNGLVGVGTTVPTEALDVRGRVRVIADSAVAGSGVVNATMAFDGFVSTATTVSLEAGELDTIDVHYIPTVSGISTGTITCDASASVTGDGAAFNAGTFVLTPDANDGQLVFGSP